jgi:copper resistance protein C
MWWKESSMKKLIPITLLALTSTAALAHTELETSTPADKAVLDSAPKEIVLTFSEGAKLTAVSIEQRGSKKEEIRPLPTEMSEKFVLAAPTLEPGAYVISWRAVADDMHVASGEISFEIRGASTTAH